MNWLSAIWEVFKSLASPVLSFIGVRQTNKTNRQIASENIAYQERENEIARQREDTAYSRSAEDMKRAGLSKTLAAGNPASSNLMNAPHNDYRMQNELEKLQLAEAYYGVQQAKANVDNTKADTQAKDAQAQYTNTQNENYVKHLASKIELNEARSEFYRAESKLSNLKGDNFVRELDATLKKIESETNLNWSKNKSEQEYTKLIKEQVISEMKRQKLISAQTQSQIYSYMNDYLDYKIKMYNFGFAKSHNNPYNYNYALRDSVLASSAINAGSNIASGLLKALISAGNYASPYPSNLSLSF